MVRLYVYLDTFLCSSFDQERSHHSGCLDASLREFHGDAIVSEVAIK